MRRSSIIAACLVVYLVPAAIAAAYLAGAAFFVLNKTMPHGIGIDTWYRFWQAYAVDPLQHQRLLLSAGFACAVALGVPLCAMRALGQRDRSLHGDARWASAGEIRRAGLL